MVDVGMVEIAPMVKKWCAVAPSKRFSCTCQSTDALQMGSCQGFTEQLIPTGRTNCELGRVCLEGTGAQAAGFGLEGTSCVLPGISGSLQVGLHTCPLFFPCEQTSNRADVQIEGFNTVQYSKRSFQDGGQQTCKVEGRCCRPRRPGCQTANNLLGLARPRPPQGTKPSSSGIITSGVLGAQEGHRPRCIRISPFGEMLRCRSALGRWRLRR